MAEKLVRIREAAKHMDVCEKTVRRWIKAGRLDARLLGPRTLRVVFEVDEGAGEHDAREAS